MIASKQYITDLKGERISVILPIRDYESMLEELEAWEDVRLYDQIKASGQEYLSAQEVFSNIEAKREMLCRTE